MKFEKWFEPFFYLLPPTLGIMSRSPLWALFALGLLLFWVSARKLIYDVDGSDKRIVWLVFGIGMAYLVYLVVTDHLTVRTLWLATVVYHFVLSGTGSTSRVVKRWSNCGKSRATCALGTFSPCTARLFLSPWYS